MYSWCTSGGSTSAILSVSLNPTSCLTMCRKAGEKTFYPIFFSRLYLDCKLWIHEVLFINQSLKASGLAGNLEEQWSVVTVLSLACSASSLLRGLFFQSPFTC